jgi:hypothetical protein
VAAWPETAPIAAHGASGFQQAPLKKFDHKLQSTAVPVESTTMSQVWIPAKPIELITRFFIDRTSEARRRAPKT